MKCANCGEQLGFLSSRECQACKSSICDNCIDAVKRNRKKYYEKPCPICGHNNIHW